MPLRCFRIPFSTNVERVALAAGHKGLEIEWIDVDPDDRSPVVAASGQPRVPVLEADGMVLFDSPRILEWLEERYPTPALLPADPSRRAEVRTFVDWFNRVWKRLPNELEGQLVDAEPDPTTSVDALSAEMRAAIGLFEALLEGRDYLLWSSTSASLRTRRSTDGSSASTPAVAASLARCRTTSARTARSAPSTSTPARASARTGLPATAAASGFSSS